MFYSDFDYVTYRSALLFQCISYVLTKVFFAILFIFMVRINKVFLFLRKIIWF